MIENTLSYLMLAIGDNTPPNNELLIYVPCTLMKLLCLIKFQSLTKLSLKQLLFSCILTCVQIHFLKSFYYETHARQIFYHIETLKERGKPFTYLQIMDQVRSSL